MTSLASRFFKTIRRFSATTLFLAIMLPPALQARSLSDYYVLLRG